VVSNTVTDTKLPQVSVSVRAFDEDFTLGVPGVAPRCLSEKSGWIWLCS
jgi:hypothetical protein